MICDLCKEKDETQEHLSKCQAYADIIKKVKGKQSINEIIKQNNIHITSVIIQKIFKRRETILKIYLLPDAANTVIGGHEQIASMSPCHQSSACPPPS